MKQEGLFNFDGRREKDRPRDEIWDAAVAIFYRDGVPSGQRRYVNRLVQDLRELHATPEKLRRRVDIYPSVFPGCVCTLSAIVKHWGILRPERPKLHPGGNPDDPIFQMRLRQWEAY